MFIYTKENQFIYPVNFQRDFPNVSFSYPITDDQLPEGVFRIKQVSPPEAQFDEKVTENFPTEVDGVWTQKWLVEKLSDVELQNKINDVASSVRSKRSHLLYISDWTQGKDISDEVSLAWQPYRQALRDITEQEGFPLNVVWPTQPE